MLRSSPDNAKKPTWPLAPGALHLDGNSYDDVFIPDGMCATIIPCGRDRRNIHVKTAMSNTAKSQWQVRSFQSLAGMVAPLAGEGVKHNIYYQGTNFSKSLQDYLLIVAGVHKLISEGFLLRSVGNDHRDVSVV